MKVLQKTLAWILGISVDLLRIPTFFMTPLNEISCKACTHVLIILHTVGRLVLNLSVKSRSLQLSRNFNYSSTTDHRHWSWPLSYHLKIVRAQSLHEVLRNVKHICRKLCIQLHLDIKSTFKILSIWALVLRFSILLPWAPPRLQVSSLLSKIKKKIRIN